MKTGNSFYCYAMQMALRDVGEGDVVKLIQAAIDQPSPETIRPVLRAGFGKPWVTRIEGALVEVGIGASSQLECGS